MTIGTGVIRGSEVVTELGVTKPYRLNSAAVRTLAGAGSTGAFRLSSLRGKSARSASITIVSSRTITTGTGNNRQSYTQVIFGVSMSDGSTPSSYLWSGAVNGTGSQVTFNGPAYSPGGFTYQENATQVVDVVVGGQTFRASYNFTYTAGDQV